MDGDAKRDCLTGREHQISISAVTGQLAHKRNGIAIALQLALGGGQGFTTLIYSFIGVEETKSGSAVVL
jgi:hypothetical protein